MNYKDLGAIQSEGRSFGALQAPGTQTTPATPSSASWATIAALAVAVITIPAAPSSSAWATNAATARAETTTPATPASAAWASVAATSLRRYHNVTLEVVSSSDSLAIEVVSHPDFTVEVLS